MLLFLQKLKKVVCNNENGDKILREIENPAHNEWKASNWRNSQNKTEQKGVLASRLLFLILHCRKCE